MKKTIIIVVIIILVVLGAVFFFSQLNKAEPDQDQGTEEQAGSLELLVNEPVVSPSLSFSGDTIWYFDKAGKLFRKTVADDSLKQEFALPAITGFLSVIWQPSGSNFIVEQNQDGHSTYQVYDAELGSLIPYPDRLTKPRFTATSSSIVYDWVGDDGLHQLKTSNLTSTEFRTITDLFRSDYEIAASPTKNEVVLYSQNQLDPSKIYLVSLDTGEFRDMSAPVAVQGVRFSPDGEQIAVAAWNDGGVGMPSLYIQDLVDLNIFVPGQKANIEQIEWNSVGSELFIADSSGISKINVITNTASKVFQFNEPNQLEPAELIVHPTKPILFFVDKKTGYLYRIDLPKGE